MNNYIDTKIRIYESYDAGIITESEKYELLNVLEASGKVDHYVRNADKYGEVKSNTSTSTNQPGNSKFGQAVRKVDVLNNKLRRKEITQDEFKKEFDKLKDIHGSALDKRGSNVFDDGPRKNKNKHTMKPSDFKVTTGDDSNRHVKYARNDNVDKNTAEKLKHHYDICRTTDDYNEFQNHRRAICNILGLPKDSTINGIGLIKNQKTGKTELKAAGMSDKYAYKYKDGTKAIHGSKQKNLKYLNPVYRSSEKTPVLYANKRAYFYMDPDEYDNNRGSAAIYGKNEYQYTGDKLKTARYDPESGNGAVYIPSKDKFKVTQTKCEWNPPKKSSNTNSASKPKLNNNHDKKIINEILNRISKLKK